jgi:hypothetical protein
MFTWEKPISMYGFQNGHRFDTMAKVNSTTMLGSYLTEDGG